MVVTRAAARAAEAAQRRIQALLDLAAEFEAQADEEDRRLRLRVLGDDLPLAIAIPRSVGRLVPYTGAPLVGPPHARFLADHPEDRSHYPALAAVGVISRPAGFWLRRWLDEPLLAPAFVAEDALPPARRTVWPRGSLSASQ